MPRKGRKDRNGENFDKNDNKNMYLGLNLGGAFFDRRHVFA